MTLLQPIWLILIIPLALALWVWRLPSRWLLVLRSVALVLLLLALCELSVLLPGQAGTIIVLCDRSLSMPASSPDQQRELLERHLPGGMHSDDRLGVISFGETLAVEQAPQSGRFAGFTHEVGRDASNLANGLETALSLIPPDRPGRVLVLSDGRWTGRDPAIVASRAAARNIPVDYRLMQRPLANDVAIARVDTPARVNPGEVFLLTAWVTVPSPQEVSFELQRGNRVLVAGKRQLEAGMNRLTFRDQADDPGTQAYTLRVAGRDDDPVPENNLARLLIGVDGHRPILHVCESPKSGLPNLLTGGGLKVKSLAPEACEWTIDELSNYSAVILENVPAQKVGTAGMETLAAWVRESGSGLMMTGGRNSYGPGGYYLSPLEAVMPVSMELRQEHRKLSVAIVVALDRSGSMAVPVSGGKVKMDLANLGTVEVLNMLSAKDEFGLLAVDSAPHVIAGLAPVTDKARIKNDVLRIQSMGGGIFVYEALAKAAEMIMPATPATKHIILFSDAADSEQPGDYKNLLDKMS
ncbi:MAG: VWA domain-containing protein [Gemmataceae bacterium]